MKINELLEAKDEHGWMEKAVHKILDGADSAALIKKKDADIVALVQNAQNAGSLHFAPSQKLLPYVKSWRAKQKVAEGEVVTARFGTKGPMKDSGITVPPGYERFKLEDEHIFGMRNGKWLKISKVSNEKLGKALVKAYNNGGMTDDDIKPISLMQAFGSDELAALDAEGIKLAEKPGYWTDFEEGGYREKYNIHEVKLKKIEKTIGKLPIIDSADIYGGPLKPKGPMSSVRMMPDEQMFIVKFGDGTKYLADRTGASAYIRFWQKII